MKVEIESGIPTADSKREECAIKASMLFSWLTGGGFSLGPVRRVGLERSGAKRKSLSNHAFNHALIGGERDSMSLPGFGFPFVTPLLCIMLFSLVLVGFCGCGGVDVDTQIKRLKAKDPVARISAAFELGESKSKKAVMPLVSALSDSDIRVRKRSAEALGKIGDGRSAKALAKCLSDKDIPLRNLCRQALVKIGAPAVPYLIQLLRSDNQRLREEAGKMLVSIGAPSVKPLIALLEDENPEIKAKAATLLGEIGFIAAHDPLKKALEDPDERVRQAAAQALDKIIAASKQNVPKEEGKQQEQKR